MGFFTGARKAAKEFGEGMQDGFEQRQQYHANKSNPTTASNPDVDKKLEAKQLLNQHINDLVVHEGKRAFGVNTDEVKNNISGMLENPEFLNRILDDKRINKYRVQANTDLRNEGQQVIDAIGKGVPAEQFNTDQRNIGLAVIENQNIENRQSRKNDIVFGLHPNGPSPEALNDIRFRSDYQQINMEDKELFNRAGGIAELASRGEIDVKDLNNADLKRAQLFQRQKDVKDHARLFRRGELTQDMLDNLDPKTVGGILEKAKADNNDMNELGMQMWNSNNPNDQVDFNEFSNRRAANEEEGRRMAGDRMVGAGEFGFVFEGATPGVLIKQEAPTSVAWNSGAGPGTGMSEISNLADLQGAPGVPKMFDAQQLNDGTTRIAMEDLRDNYENYRDVFGDTELDQATDIKRFQQQGGFNLRGIDIADRHEGNVMVHALTGRPMQVDFGIGSKLNNNHSKAIALQNNTADGFSAAGLQDEAEIYYGLVNDLLKEGKDDDAYKMAKQGFAQLQKIKKPVNAKRASQLV